MRKIIILFTTILFVLSSGCHSHVAEYGMMLGGAFTSKIIVRASKAEFATGSTTGSEALGQVIFTGDDILWFNETTKELRFKDNLLSKPVVLDHAAISFYMDDAYLFSSIIYASSLSSQIYNSLVLFYNITENKFFLLNGYPDISILQNTDGNSFPAGAEDMAAVSQELRAENMQKIASEWNIFINQLKKEGRHRN